MGQVYVHNVLAITKISIVGLINIQPKIQNFRTSSHQPDCKNYGGGITEMTPALETYAAVLSGGPVGPSDQIGMANATLIKATWYV